MSFKIQILSLLTCVGLFSLSARAGQHQSQSLISNSTNMLVTAGSTNKYGVSNAYYSSEGQLVTNANCIADGALWDNPDGSVANGNFSCLVVGTNAGFTNILTVVLTAVPRRAEGDTNAATQAAAQQSFAIQGNGTTPVLLVTNIVDAAFEGSSGLRPEFRYPTQGAGTNTSTAFVLGAHLNGFH